MRGNNLYKEISMFDYRNTQPVYQTQDPMEFAANEMSRPLGFIFIMLVYAIMEFGRWYVSFEQRADLDFRNIRRVLIEEREEGKEPQYHIFDKMEEANAWMDKNQFSYMYLSGLHVAGKTDDNKRDTWMNIYVLYKNRHAYHRRQWMLLTNTLSGEGYKGCANYKLVNKEFIDFLRKGPSSKENFPQEAKEQLERLRNYSLPSSPYYGFPKSNGWSESWAAWAENP